MLHRIAPLLALIIVSTAARAEEGMWTLDNLPAEAMADRYDFEPDAAWALNVQRSSVRLASGCSGSFVSPSGLVLTNHHCISRCLSQLSSPELNLLDEGYVASTLGEERRCPAMEINQLLDITDVTEQIQAATEGLTDSDAGSARKTMMSQLESNCAGEAGASLRCDVVTLYKGGRHHLYRYQRYQDVRLAFAPETAIAAFGGDPDNFNFPRFDLDMGLLRIYEDGEPISSPNHFRIKPDGAAAGELVMVTGHPGRTDRLMTMAQLATLRETILPQRLVYLSELRGVLRQFGREGDEQRRMSQRDLFGVENALKAFKGRYATLMNPEFWAAQEQRERDLRDAVEDKKAWRKAYGDAWDNIAQAQRIWSNVYTEYSFLELHRGLQSELFDRAFTLVRAAQERPKPNGERYREYTEAALPQLTQRLFSAAPIHRELEILTLTWSLEKLREYLGVDHPAVVAILGRQSPDTVARTLIEGTQLDNVAMRRKLWEGGSKAVAASGDPMIVLARVVEPIARDIRDRYQEQVESVVDAGTEKIARALFAIHGTDLYPDATFSLRLSYGTVQGWTEKGRTITPFTDLDGMYARATGYPPYRLPASWLAVKDSVDGNTRINFVTTNDIIGGNSGSPVINREAQLVGLIFDGNIHSLGGAFGYDGALNRAVAVHPATMRTALKSVYPAERLAQELFGR